VQRVGSHGWQLVAGYGADQFRISLRKHPAIKALAPMEALDDPDRDLVCRGGRPSNTSFHKFSMEGFSGPNFVEKNGRHDFKTFII
jgi:hypothetical protein